MGFNIFSGSLILLCVALNLYINGLENSKKHCYAYLMTILYGIDYFVR